MINDGIKICQKKQKSFEILEFKLKSATSHQDIVKECNNVTTEVMQNQKWDETIRKDLNVKNVRLGFLKTKDEIFTKNKDI